MKETVLVALIAIGYVGAMIAFHNDSKTSFAGRATISCGSSDPWVGFMDRAREQMYKGE